MLVDYCLLYTSNFRRVLLLADLRVRLMVPHRRLNLCNLYKFVMNKKIQKRMKSEKLSVDEVARLVNVYLCTQTNLWTEKRSGELTCAIGTVILTLRLWEKKRQMKHEKAPHIGFMVWESKWNYNEYKEELRKKHHKIKELTRNVQL